MAARGNGARLAAALRALGVLAIAACVTACATDVPGYAIVTQDKFDFMTCREIIGHRAALTTRDKELSASAAKAEASPGGFIAGTLAYRSELSSTRAQLFAADRAFRKNNCDAPPK